MKQYKSGTCRLSQVPFLCLNGPFWLSNASFMTACKELRVLEENRCLSYCNRCNHSTHHDVLHRQHVADEEVDASQNLHEEWTYTYTLLQCRGCDDVSMKIDHWHSAYGQVDPELYPPRISRKSPAWLWKLPSNWWSLMREIYGALHSDSRRLAVMGHEQ